MTSQSSQVAIAIQESSLAEACAAAARLAAQVGSDEGTAERLSTVVAELTRNLKAHAREGELLLRPLAGSRGVEVLAVDMGPGMSDVGEHLRDNSTAGTPGTGLGAVRRLADLFDIYSRQGVGTAVLARVVSDTSSRRTRLFDAGVVCAAKTGEPSGHVWKIQNGPRYGRFLLVDSLGDSSGTAEAAEEAVRVFEEFNPRSWEDMISVMDGVLRQTRSAVLGITQVDPQARTVEFFGHGNISAILATPEGDCRSMVARDGAVAHAPHQLQRFTQAWSAATVLIMHTHGLTVPQLNRYPGLLSRHPALIAGRLYRDRKRDDHVTVLVAREYVAS